ncbi:MAG: 4Fe-4S binding protein [Synergistaceae bacterium]|jgi:polyferredoxin|nr:4Fe-4S binding protein [Synergistaceae bacterium]
MSRKIIQWLVLLGSNAYLPGFFSGRIYKGELKSVCVPGLNCYSCPGAVASCPLGALQAVLGDARYKFSFYVTGLMLGFGFFFGRFICGFLCPFGLLQELLHKIPLKISFRAERTRVRYSRWIGGLRYFKYFILASFVVALPLLTKESMGVGAPTFCKYICPAGTLTAGLPLVAANPPLRSALGGLFALKCAIAFATVLGCLQVYRFFCKFLCPLGAFYGLFNKVALYRIRLEKESCSHCGACSRACKMGVDPSLAPDSPECIRCGDCVKACRFSALTSGFLAGEKNNPRTLPKTSTEVE